MNTETDERASGTLLRLRLCGSFCMEWADASGERVLAAPAPLVGGRDRGAAIALLALLSCQPDRRAQRDWVMEQFWPDEPRSTALHRLQNIFLCLRGLLRPPDGGQSLLRSIMGRRSSGPCYSLEAYPRLWVDRDALIWNVAQAARLERLGADAFPCWQRAFALLGRGPFLVDSPYDPSAPWVSEQRERLDGYARQCVHALAHLYVARAGEAGKAEALLVLHTYWQEHKTDEDALRPLLELLAEQGRFQEAEAHYQQLLLALAIRGPDDGEGRHRTPDERTRALVEDLRARPAQRSQMVGRFPVTLSPAPPTGPPPLASPTQRQEGSGASTLFDLGIMALMMHQGLTGWDGGALTERVTRALESAPSEFPHSSLLPRRSVLSLLFGLPLMVDGLTRRFRQSAPSLVAEEVLPLYVAGLSACWRCYFEGGQLQVERVLPHYLTHLTQLAENPSRLQRRAAGLLSQTYQLMALLAQGHERFAEAVEFCRQAAMYGRFAQDANLQAMAYIRLQDTYWEHQEFDQCFVTLKQAELLAKQASPLLQGRIYARLAHVYAHRCELTLAQQYLDVAQRVFPPCPELDAGFVYSHSTHFVLYANEVTTRIKLGQLQKAREAIVNAEKFVPGQSNPRRIDVTQYQMQVALAVGDLEQCCALFEQLIRVVKALGHELDRSNTSALYHALRDRWPREGRVVNLKPLLF